MVAVLKEGLDVTVTKSSYAIAGSTIAELRSVLHVLGPTRNGRAFAAFTDWTVDWEFDGDADRHLQARIVCVRVRVRADVMLPRWRPPRSTSSQTIAAWQRYLTAVETHEQGHVNLAVEAGRAVLASLEGLGEFAKVDDLRCIAVDAAHEAVATIRERELIYDQETQHGASQGATLRDG